MKISNGWLWSSVLILCSDVQTLLTYFEMISVYRRLAKIVQCSCIPFTKFPLRLTSYITMAHLSKLKNQHSLLWGVGVLCIVQCLAASLVSTHCMPVPSPPKYWQSKMSVDIAKASQGKHWNQCSRSFIILHFTV